MRVPIELIEEMVEDANPSAVEMPTAQPIIDCLPRPLAFRNIPPRRGKDVSDLFPLANLEFIAMCHGTPAFSADRAKDVGTSEEGNQKS